ncbi:sodium/glucose cotransporter 4-like [Mercenaria mercenaria]|uniref:sodium/glucose cotransporter 4-like n=1 Tax=Mercenaria mercenaria TaxID=6596 RepID=UPI00234EF720|nr:sodium/glucose cotransporter 4-like [Mercenaria mercenaria]
MERRGLTHWGDIFVVVVYIVAVLLVGIWSTCRRKRGTVRTFFLAGRSMPWIPVGASLFSSNIGSEHFLGLAGTGAASGIAIIIYEWLGMPLVILLAWIFVPVYVSAGVYTMPEYLQKRFGGQRIRVYLSVLSMVLYILAKLSVSIFAGALFIQMAMGWNVYVSIAVLLFITALFTILGGLTAVIYTDTFQTAVMLIGAVVLSAISFNKIGGYENLRDRYMNSTPLIRDINSTCGLPRDDAFNIFRHPLYGDLPWPGLILHMLIACTWYWCNDQVIVQRSLASKTLLHAKAGSLLAGYLKILPLFIMLMPGMISRVLYPDEVACVDPEECEKYCGNPTGCSNLAYPLLVFGLLPTGLRGLLVAVMLSAIMSSLTSIFNSASTLFTIDLWPRFRHQASEREKLIVGRVFIAVICSLSILWTPLVRSSQSGQLFIYINAIQGYLATSIGPVFFFAALWSRMTEKAAFWSLVLPQICGIARLVLDLTMPAPVCGEPDTRPTILSAVHYTYFALIQLAITTILIIIISLFTKPKENIDGLTFWTIKRYSGTEVESTLETEPSHLGSKLKTQVSEEDSTPEDDRIENLGKFKMFIYRLCGIPLVGSQEQLREEKELIYKEIFLKENPFWKNVIDINAVIGLVVVAFLVGYFH